MFTPLMSLVVIVRTLTTDPDPVAVNINSAVVFAFASVAIIWLSKRSLRHPSSHGFARFFAFEAILGLLVVNAPHWFAHPLAPVQLISWLLLVTSLALVLWALILLSRHGRHRASAADSADFAWENTTNLVTTGVYRRIRHPMYASLLLLAWGALLKSVTLAALLLTAVASTALVMAARAEEVENVARFGDAYRDYVKRTSAFIPFVY